MQRITVVNTLTYERKRNSLRRRCFQRRTLLPFRLAFSLRVIFGVWQTESTAVVITAAVLLLCFLFIPSPNTTTSVVIIIVVVTMSDISIVSWKYLLIRPSLSFPWCSPKIRVRKQDLNRKWDMIRCTTNGYNPESVMVVTNNSVMDGKNLLYNFSLAYEEELKRMTD